MQKQSFSLLELVVALALVILIISFSIPKNTLFTKILVTNELETLHTTFLYLKQKAVATNQQQTLFISVTTNSYWYNNPQRVTHTLPPRVIFGFLPQSKGPPGNPTKPITKAITFPLTKDNLYKVSFYPQGTMSAGTVYLANQNKTIMKALTTPIGSIPFLRKYSCDTLNQWKMI